MSNNRKQMLKIEAPAKINLTLEVLGKRPDGYHEIRSVIQTINFSDSFQIKAGHTIKFSSNMPDWSPEQSLVSKAAYLLQRVTGCNKGAEIEIKKRHVEALGFQQIPARRHVRCGVAPVPKLFQFRLQLERYERLVFYNKDTHRFQPSIGRRG